MRATSKARTPRRLAAGAVVAATVGWSLTAVPGGAAAEQADSGPELVFEQSGPIDGVRPGDSVAVPFAVKNKGDAPATRVVLYLRGSQGLAYDKRYSNCVYEDAPAQDEGPAQVNAECDIEQTLEPGVVYEPAEPIGLDVLDRALYERLNLNILAGVGTFPEGTQHGGGADPVLRLVARTAPEAPGTVHGGELATDITAENTADFALTGSKVKGERGRTVDAKVTFANKGPAWARNDVYGPIGVFDVGIPRGTTVTKVPEFCEPAGAATYRCTTPYNYADEDSERAYVFGLRIDKVVANATGAVAFVKGDHHWGTLPFDRNRTNNTAEITVNASDGGAAAGGASGGATGGTDGGAGSSGSTSGTGGTGSTSGTGTQLGELAETGSGDTLLAGGAAVALLAAGGAAVAVRRRTS
ncbi:peptidase [Streptomyces sp. IB2014 016-6]|uniref:peptidase n=1 Tax=Streptomyces sp. IB2014 016-6 TaxID=2517818 RepID=UPI0011C7A0F7|nr:peptidase [Streptomyces sp. IB2014 016-6]TXL89538.1 peptidase [Streptomyces sp. IB2014 016-6]